MKVDRKKVTADQILDLYAKVKKEKKLAKKEELMRKVIFLSQHLNEYLKTADLVVK